MFMSAQANMASLKHMEAMLVHYAWLERDAHSRGELLYNIVPKFHMCWHLADHNRFMNARFCWTYKCESWVGKVSHLAASCAHGTKMSHLSLSLAEKYRLLVHFRFTRGVLDEWEVPLWKMLCLSKNWNTWRLAEGQGLLQTWNVQSTTMPWKKKLTIEK